MCGIIGIASINERASDLAYFGLFALQHRGQEASGIATSNNGEIFLHKDMGTIEWVFRKQVPVEDVVGFVLAHKDMEEAELITATKEFEQKSRKAALARLPGNVAIGHVRYSTTGASGNKNIHPILFGFQGKSACIAHNGNLVRLKRLREIVEARGGYNFEGSTDTELIATLIATSSKETFYEALLETLPLLEGAFSLVLLYDDAVYAVKDKFAIRPLCVGRAKNAYIAASETCALDTLEDELLKELEPGEGAILQPTSIEYFKWHKGGQWRGCIFDHAVYFSRPDSVMRGKSAKEIRKASGRLLAKNYPVLRADLVIPVPDSGNAPAEGYAEELSIPLGRNLLSQAIIRSHFTGRTFIEPVVELRHEYRRIKYNPIRSDIKGKVIVVVDDSIVRGTTIPHIVRLLKDFGAKEVHVRVASPPIRHGCHLGVDLPWEKDLIAAGKSVEQVRLAISAEAGVEVDSLEYLSLDDLLQATGLPPDSFCTGCFNKNWPVPPEESDYDPKRA